MKLADLLTVDHISVPLRATGLEEGIGELLGRLAGTAGLTEAGGAEIAAGLVSGEVGELTPLSTDTALAIVRVPGAEELVGAIGVASVPLATDIEDVADRRTLVVLLTPRRLSTLRGQVIPELTRVFRDGRVSAAVLACRAPGELREIRSLMEVELDERLLVEDALSPVSYRVYPDTPMSEVLDLITRRGLHVVPVVGESYEVLGMITAAEALKFLLQQKRRGETSGVDDTGESPASARDVMSRTVMCVAEDQSLMEAANLMVNRDVAQLPVVREGELIGFLTRDAALQRLQR